MKKLIKIYLTICKVIFTNIIFDSVGIEYCSVKKGYFSNKVNFNN